MEREGKEMNAEELAVKMEMGNYDWADEAATMLRQQQAEIEALKRHRNRLETLAEQMLQGDGND